MAKEGRGANIPQRTPVVVSTFASGRLLFCAWKRWKVETHLLGGRRTVIATEMEGSRSASVAPVVSKEGRQAHIILARPHSSSQSLFVSHPSLPSHNNFSTVSSNHRSRRTLPEATSSKIRIDRITRSQRLLAVTTRHPRYIAIRTLLPCLPQAA